MARKLNMTRIVLAGKLPNGEIFQTGFWVDNGGLGNEAQANELATAVAALWNTGPGSYMNAFLSSTASYVEVIVYGYTGATGPAQYVGGAPITTGPGSGPASDQLPLQTCLVLTLETGLSGRRRRGRMYFPLIVTGLSNHQVPVTQIQQISDLMAAFFSAVNDIGDGTTVVVHSQVGAGDTAPVTRVSCDSETDVQRRRANRQVELNQSSAAVS